VPTYGVTEKSNHVPRSPVQWFVICSCMPEWILRQ